jgi:NADH-quinone oxidoreductase subunit L
MSVLLLWAWLFTIPGLLLTAFGVGRKPGSASVGGPVVMVLVALGAIATGAHADFNVPGWLPFLPDGAFRLRVDSLAAVMLAVVGAVSTCVYVYSLGYMDEEPEGGQRRFFCYLDFFLASMALLVLAGNIAVLLIGWSGVGLASFLLISYWTQKPGTLRAGLEALAANAIGDAALLLALVVVPNGCGDLTTLGTSACTAGAGGAVLLASLILIAAAAKSAQGPLYFWLPSAMAGPTPVSALIHAATMVAAGVYLLARTHALLDAAPSVAHVTALLGVITVLGGGILSLQQSNFKRGLAYSTVSQLGYMFAAVGLGSPFAAMFHLVTHASFKALLFLTSGVVIHALHGHEELAVMGGLRKALPGAYAAFLIGALALIGVPLFSGSFSKDAILEVAQTHDFLPPVNFFGLFLGVFLTGLYTGRLFFGVFHGARRYHGELRRGRPAMETAMYWSLVPLAIGAVFLGYLEWPVPLLSTFLHDTLGEAESVQPSALGLIAGLFGLVGFGLAGWWWRPQPSTVPAQVGGVQVGLEHARGEEGAAAEEPPIGWVEALAGLSYGIARLFASVQGGHLGRYMLVTVLGIAVILLLTLAGSSVGVSQTFVVPGPR